ncbi:PREDICTED: serine/threonine-protein kinase EDR1 isoform X2 [Nelumbo nucifera]|uniref:non-specific serine/threonine protein kinase n=1 Tax=Nelumbo nucifera TaxID=4432 RepID=A0A1U8AAB4_NELNU|nr:PREDICTED: serine/threonine-protein kinase EDR1 isoform X2 [Nelumbo nucifera]
MSRMKHLLRKLHIGGSVNEHHRLGGSRANNSPSPPSLPSSASASHSSSTGSTFARNRVGDAADRTTGAVSAAASAESSVDFNFFEEEFQVQLALAISASDPDAREDPESAQIKAAKRISLGCSSVAADETLVELLSLQYWNYNVVNYDDKVMDGFYDVYGISTNSNLQGKMPLLVDLQATAVSDSTDYEVILVNRSVDPILQQLERRADSIALECQAAKLGQILSGLVQKIADLVANTMGGPVGDADVMLRRWTARSNELRNSLKTIVLPLGCLDVGLSRHRALLFKVLADRINLPCRLVKGSYYTGTDEGAVNLIKIDYESEYIIDLMGAPGTLIPAEVPSGHIQNSGLNVVSSVSTSDSINDSYFTRDKINCQSENGNQVSGGIPFDPGCSSQTGILGSNEASSVIQVKGDNDSSIEESQTERFEYEFGKLLPSLYGSHKSPSGTGEKASSAQRMKVKYVSKYVTTAAQNPEFAQKLHAVLLESGASPPPDLFSDISTQDPEGCRALVRSHFVKGEKIHDETQCYLNKLPSSTEHAIVPFVEVESLNHVVYENKQKSSVWNMTEEQKQDANISSDVQLWMPTASSSTSKPVTRTPYGEQIQESSLSHPDNSHEKKLQNILTSAAPEGNKGNVGRIANNAETTGSISLQEHPQNAQGSLVKLMETAINDQYIVDRERVNLQLDEVAEWEIPWEDLQIGERIGLGSYGEVYRADWNGTEVAVKKFLDQDFSGDALQQFRCEVMIMLRLRHPNVVLFMGAVTWPPNLSILTEFLPRGSLYRLMHRPNVQLDEKRRLRMALDVAKGMNYLHTSHPTIVHRDLKSPNLLVDKNWVVKVCDFGLSRLKHHTFLSSKSTAGTPEWMAPEVLRNERSNEKCDVYSFGVILWELATLRMPWSGMNPMQVVGAVGFQNRRLDIPEEVDPAVRQIICDCWQSEAELRPSFSQLLTPLKRLQRLVVEKP